MDATGKRVLLVDDDVDLVDLVRIRLEKCGYQVEWCSNGEKAIESFHREKPQAIILDMEMPKKNGLSTLLELRDQFEHGDDTHPASGKIPVIVITGLGGSTIKELVKDAGVYDFLQKPFNITALADKLAEAMAKSA